MTLTPETIARFREDGAAAMRANEPNIPDHRSLFRLALSDIPPGFRENGPTVTALREQWHHGYTGAARLDLAERYGDDVEEAMRAEWTVTCHGDGYAALLCVAVLRAGSAWERDECRADLRQYLGEALDEQHAAVQSLAG